MHFVRNILLLAVVAMVGCGGGGGGGGGSGSGPSGPTFSMSATSATFSATQGGTAPPPQAVTLTAINGTVYVATSQTGSGFNHSLQAPGTATGTITITPDFPTIAGTFTGTITVRGCPDQACTTDVSGSPKVITVTYTVAPAPTLTTAPTTVDFVTAVGQTPPAKHLDVNLSSGSAGWTATAAYSTGTPNFLSVTPAAGSTLPQTVTLNVASVPPVGTYRATIVFSAAGLTRIVPVSLTVRAPVVNFVSPYVETTNVSGAVIIRGFGFSNLASGSLQVLFGGTAASSATVVSDTEIQAVHPPLASGSYSIAVQDGTQIIPSRSGLQLLVTDPPSFPAVSITRLGFFPGPVASLIYDGERRALYLMDSQNNELERYQFAAGWSGTSISTGTGGGNTRIALSPDGKLLVKTAGLGTDMFLIDVPTFNALPSVSAAALLGGDAHLNLIAFANDGGAIGNAYSPTSGITLYRYDMLTQVFTALSNQADMTNRAIVASADEDTLVMPSFESLDPTFAKPVFTYAASDGSLMQRSVTSTGTDHASVSRNGARVVLVNSPASPSQVTTVYDVSPTSFAARGTLPAGLNAFVISPDGSTAYAYFNSSKLVRKFNLNAPNGSGGFQEVGSGTTVATPDSGSSPALPNDFFAAMTMTQDGGTIFLAGNQRIVVLPAP